MSLQIERLKGLPQRAKDAWQGGLIRLPMYVHKINKEPYPAPIELLQIVCLGG